jgi:hypothetical protein
MTPHIQGHGHKPKATERHVRIDSVRELSWSSTHPQHPCRHPSFHNWPTQHTDSSPVPPRLYNTQGYSHSVRVWPCCSTVQTVTDANNCRLPPVFGDVDYCLDLLIRIRQRKVHNRQYHSPARRDPPYVGPHICEPAYITCLQLYLQTPSDCDRAGALINLAPSVKSLAIEFGSRVQDEQMYGNSHTTRRYPWEIVRRLFVSVKGNTPRVGLQSLRITSFPLTSLERVLPTKFPMQTLKHVQFIKCPWVGEFIQMLSRLGVNLVSYFMSSEHDHAGIRGPNEKLLSLMAAPKHLKKSSLCGDMLCGWSVLTSRAASLQSLDIADDYTENDDPVIHRGMEGFLPFYEAASSLESLP